MFKINSQQKMTSRKGGVAALNVNNIYTRMDIHRPESGTPTESIWVRIVTWRTKKRYNCGINSPNNCKSLMTAVRAEVTERLQLSCLLLGMDVK